MERLLLFPEPLPDESLYSLVVRYHRMVANVSYRKTSQELFGSYSRTCASILPCCLGELSARTEGVITVPRLLNSLTLLPLYQPFLPDSAYEFAAQQMKGSDGTGLQMRLGITASGFLKFASFRYCESCIAHDSETHGIAYWHRIHQAIGVCVCPVHGTALTVASSPQHSEWSSLLLPGEAGGTQLLSPEGCDAMEVVAEMQSWGLENPEAVSELLRGGFLRGRLSDMGFLLNGRLKLGALSEFIVNRIDRCGSKYEYGFAAKGLGWVFDILRHRRRIIQPFRFYLLCWVLEATSEELRRFEARGAEITKMGQVPLSSMPKNISPDKLERIRKSFSDDSFTRCHDREGYHWLYANDRVWLHDYVAARPRQKKAFQRVDWYARDEILSQELIAAKTALDRVLEKPIKVTKTELLRRVTDSFGIARNPGRLPRSNELIHEFVESDHDFQLRNLHWVLGKRSDLIGCALSVILRACGIRVIKVTEYEVEAIMNELWKDDWHALKS